MAIPPLKPASKSIKKTSGELVVSKKASSPVVPSESKSEKRSRPPRASIEKRVELGRETQDELDAEVERLMSIKTSPQENDYLVEYVRTYRKLQQIILIKEAQVISGGANQRDVYALSMLYSQIREVIADMRTLSDMTQQTNMLIDRVLVPYKSDLVQTITDVYYQLRKLLSETSKQDSLGFAVEKLEGLVRDLAKAVQINSDTAIARVTEILNGPDEQEAARKKKKRARP